jgi:hypothetical protein
LRNNASIVHDVTLRALLEFPTFGFRELCSLAVDLPHASPHAVNEQ